MTELPNADLDRVRAQAHAALEKITDAASLEAWRVTYLGRKGALSQILRGLKDVPVAERQARGPVAQALREELLAAYAQRAGSMTKTDEEKSTAQKPITTLPALPERGHAHPLTLTLQRIQGIFTELGFTVVEGPEVEDPQYNFDLLNIPPTHPTRAETDTFYLTTGQVLRVHTSPVQLRAVLENNLTPPFKILSPGRVFRAERTDATHESTFYQFEGLVVSTATTIADFKGVITAFYSQFFGTAATIRLRPSYFPFVEPGFEVDIHCVFCSGEGCRVCKHSGWIEVMGAGMVHPVVLKNMKLDAATYRGYAFGGAVDRLAMLYYGIDDIRLLWSGDLRFLKQFA